MVTTNKGAIMKKILLTTILFGFIGISNLMAQFVVDTNATVYISDNETMYVQAPTPNLIIRSGGILKLERGGKLDIDGSITLETGAIIEMDATSEIILGGDFIAASGVTFTSFPTSKLVFKGGTITQTFNSSDPSLKIGHLVVGTKELLLASNLSVMPKGKVEFNFSFDPEGPYITTNANRLILEASGSDFVDWIGLDTSVGDPSALKKYYVNGTIDYQTTVGDALTTYLFPVGSNQSLQLMKLELSPGAIAANNIKLIRCFYSAGAPSTVTQNACGNAVINPYTGVWDYKVYTDIAATNQIDKLNATPCDDVNSYTLTLNPRMYSVINNNFFVALEHTGDVAFNVHQFNCTGNCENYTVAGEAIAHKVSRFSKAACVEGINPFPFEITNFGAKSLKDAIYVNWTTENVQNVKYFDLERSTDTRNFKTVKSNILVQGDGKTTQNYYYADKDVVANKTYYYRLRSVEVGSSNYSKLVEGRLNSLTETSLNASVYPNPTNGALQLDLTVAYGQSVTVRMFDITGKLVLNKKVAANTGINKIELSSDFTSFATGTYNLVVQSGDSTITTKVVKN